MTGPDMVPPAALAAGSLHAPEALSRLPLEDVAASLLRSPSEFPSSFAVPLSTGQARSRIRAMSAEHASALARVACGDEDMFSALFADRRLSVRRAVAANVNVPPALRAGWLEGSSGLGARDSLVVALLAGVSMDGWPEGLLSGPAGRMVSSLGQAGWEEVLHEVPSDRLSSTICHPLFRPSPSRLSLLGSVAHRIPASCRPEEEDFSALLVESLRSGEDWRALWSRLHAPMPPWLASMLFSASCSVPDDLVVDAYEVPHVSSRFRSSTADSYESAQRVLMARLLALRASGLEARFPREVARTHLFSAMADLVLEGVRVLVDDVMLDAAAVSYPVLSGSMPPDDSHALARLSAALDGAHVGSKVPRSLFDLSPVAEPLWVSRLSRAVAAPRSAGMPETRRHVAAASLAVVLASRCGRTGDLPSALLRLCALMSSDAEVLDCLLAEVPEVVSDVLADRARELAGEVLEDEMACALVSAGVVPLVEVVDRLGPSVLGFAQRGFVPSLHSPPLVSSRSALPPLPLGEGWEGLHATFLSLPASGRLSLLAALCGPSDDAFWADAAPHVGSLVSSSFADPSFALAEEVSRLASKGRPVAAALSAAALMSVCSGEGAPCWLSLDVPEPYLRAGGGLVHGAAAVHLAGRVMSFPDLSSDVAMMLEVGRCLPVARLQEACSSGFPLSEVLGHVLGSEPEAWRLFFSMSLSWAGSVTRLAEVASSLALGGDVSVDA